MRHEVKGGLPGEPVGPEITKVRGRWTSHTKDDCRHKDKHKEWENKPAWAGTTSRPVGEISSNTSNNANSFNSIIQEQLQDQLDHEDMVWGQCLSTYPGQQGAGEQGLISKPVHAISPPHLAEVDEAEIKNLAESNEGTAIQEDSNQTEPDKEDAYSEELSEDVKQRVLRDYMRRSRRETGKGERRSRGSWRRLLEQTQS